jgi:hypothetical protein
MKGFLRRLAARAAGTTVAVRSDARLPFCGSRFGSTLTEASAPPTCAVGLPTTPTSHPSVLAPDVVHAPTHAPAPISILPRSLSAPMSDGRVSNLSQPHSSSASEPTPPRPPLARQFSTELAVANSLRRDSSAELGATLADRQPLELKHTRQESDRPQRDPSPLLPPRSPDRPGLSGATTPTSTHLPVGIQQVTARDESRGVHIHIGRIEVTAVHESAPLRGRAPLMHPPMSLETYLAKRGRT